MRSSRADCASSARPESGNTPSVAPVAPLEKEPPSAFYAGEDNGRFYKLARKHTAVLLFAPATSLPSPGADETLSRIEPTRFQPVVCVIAGKIDFGARCGEVMPARADVRLTGAAGSQDELHPGPFDHAVS